MEPVDDMWTTIWDDVSMAAALVGAAGHGLHHVSLWCSHVVLMVVVLVIVSPLLLQHMVMRVDT
jgi:hypothetical protein